MIPAWKADVLTTWPTVLKKDKSLLFRRRIWLHQATGVLLVRAILTSRVDKYVQVFVVVTAQFYLLQKNLTSYCASGIRTRNLLVMSKASYRCYYRAIIEISRNDRSIISFLDSIVNHLFHFFWNYSSLTLTNRWSEVLKNSKFSKEKTLWLSHGEFIMVLILYKIRSI